MNFLQSPTHAHKSLSSPRQATRGTARRATRRALPRPSGRTAGAALGLVFLLVLPFTVGGCAQVGDSGAAAQAASQAAADVALTTWGAAERGTPVTLSGQTFAGEPLDIAQWRGKVVVINFWYAACPPCRVEAPDLQAIAVDYPEVRMLGVNPKDDAATAGAFEQDFGISYPSIQDGDGTAVASMQGLVPLAAMPTTVVLDREGRVAGRILGRIDPMALRGLIDATLEE